jgi:chromosome partitioning protein
MSYLSSEWNNEAYVSLHLVQTMLEMAGLPRNSSYSHWHPQFKIYVHSSETKKPADFLIEDFRRYVNFLIEVKSAVNRIDDTARFQLKMYLENSGIKFGFLVDPFLVEIYELNQLQWKLLNSHNIQNPHNVRPVADFMRNFLETVKMRTIAIHTSKGGVGKTTLTVNIAFELAKMGNRVLVIDLDDQANSSLYLGANRAGELDKANTIEEFDEILKSFEDRKEVIDFLGLDFNKPTDYRQYMYLNAFNEYVYLPHNGKIDVLRSSYLLLRSKK